jgi:hypothetical protein
MPDTAMQTALKSLVKAVGWACTTYTLMQIVGGKLSGPPLLGLVVGGLVYGLGMFAFELYQRGKAGGAH